MTLTHVPIVVELGASKRTLDTKDKKKEDGTVGKG